MKHKILFARLLTAALIPLIVDRSGHGTQQLVCEPYSSDPQDSKPVNIHEKQKVDSSNGGKTDTNSSPYENRLRYR